MKNTGMNRRVDDLGRIVLPSELRKTLGLKEGTTLDIFVEEERIVLTARQESCVFCDARNELKEFKGKMICSSCSLEVSGQKPNSSWEPFAEG